MDQISSMAVPEKVIIPMEQDFGVTCEPLVGIGDKVWQGQKIGESKEVAAPIHASIAGEVVDMVMHPHPHGREVKSLIIQGSGTPKKTQIKPKQNPSPRDLRRAIREAGIIESYGLGAPVHFEKANSVILNGTDFHPYIFVDKALMIQEPGKIMAGMKVLLAASEAERGFICINASDKDTIRVMQEEMKDEANISLIPLKMVYARGMGMLLIHAVSRKSNTALGKVLISTVLKAKSIHDAIFTGQANIETLVSVTGVQRPLNLWVRTGTAFKDVIDYCGGYTGTPKRITMNSPMTGPAQYTDEVPVLKGTYGIMIQYDTETTRPWRCLRCARCVDVCPVILVPNMIALYAENNRFGECYKFNLFSCVECGYCAHGCPSRIPILQLIRYAKANLPNRGRP